MTITDKDIAALQPKSRVYKHFVGNGLFVQVQPDGSKYWRVKYRFDGRENTYSAGVFPKTSLAEAMEANQYVKSMIIVGKNPNTEKKLAKEIEAQPIEPIPFRLSLSVNGGISIETTDTKLTLSPSETNALRGFLGIDTANKGEL